MRKILLTLLLLGTVATAQAQTRHGIQLKNMDRSVRPGDDFFLYANGGWVKRTEIPADRSSVGVFGALTDIASKRTAALIEEIARSKPAAGTETRKIADLYNSYLDTAAIDARGLEPIRPMLADIQNIREKHQLAFQLGKSMRADVDPLNAGNFHTPNLFGLWVAPGFDDPTHFHAYMMQGGIELPDREYYDDQALVKKYQAHVSAMLKLIGYDNTDDRAARIVALESALAKTHRGLDASQDVNRANNPWTLDDFNAKAPGLDWGAFLAGAGLANQEKIIVWQPEAFAGEAAMVQLTPLDTWKDWMAFHLVEDYASVLPNDVANERFAFFGTTLSGAAQQRPRWTRSIAVVNALLGDAVGKLYVRRYFPPQSKATAQAMVRNIMAAFRKRIDALEWMTPATKAQAKAKLDALYIGVGYPDTWRNYSEFAVNPHDAFGNLWRAGTYDYEYQKARLGKTVNRRE